MRGRRGQTTLPTTPLTCGGRLVLRHALPLMGELSHPLRQHRAPLTQHVGAFLVTDAENRTTRMRRRTSRRGTARQRQ
jgi:hypothetical protein